MADTTPRFVLVKSVSPFNGGNFGRAGLRFTREWRALELADKTDLPNGVIDAEILTRLTDESAMLAVKEASPKEVEELARSRGGGSDKDAQLAELQAKVAGLEGLLIGQAVGAAGGGKADTKELEAQLEGQRAKNAELEARLARLESGAAAASSASPTSTPASAAAPAPGDKSAPADRKGNARG